MITLEPRPISKQTISNDKDMDITISQQTLAESIVKAASKQTYYTIRYFVDRPLVPLAYQAYAYFRWVDDTLDYDTGPQEEKIAFVKRQVALLDAFYRGEFTEEISSEEAMLKNLVKSDHREDSGLASYLKNMMAVMVFDAERRGRTISHDELASYTQSLAVAVTDALHYFIGGASPTIDDQQRYLAVTGAHITHMLRDAHEDIQSGYFNTPREYLQRKGLSENDLNSVAYQKWVCQQVSLARKYFDEGRKYLSSVRDLRCRLVGYAYTARFEWVLRTIARENYCLRSGYPDRKTFSAGLWVFGTTISALLTSILAPLWDSSLAIEGVRLEEV
jgi:phytoene/squalene synthetase